MALMTIPSSLVDFVSRSLRAAELGVRLEMAVEDIDTYRAVLDLPGPFDIAVEGDDGHVRVTAGPLLVEREQDGDLTARVDLPGPDIEVSLEDGRLSGPRFVPDSVLAKPKRTLIRLIQGGSLDAQLGELLQAEKASTARGAVVKALQTRVEAVTA